VFNQIYNFINLGKYSMTAKRIFHFIGLLLIFPLFVVAQESSVTERIEKLEAVASAAQSNADNAWMLICSALVLLMTAPGLALFYSGLVRQKNAISTILQSLILAGVVTGIWAVFGYSLVFSEGTPFLGGLDFVFLNNVGSTPNVDYAATIPQQTFMIYQLMFAIITPALITGAFAERIKFGSMLVFTALWTTLIYLPLAHMVWGKGGFFNATLGGVIPALDFAGGTVVHISSGVSALVCALYIGKRVDIADNMPHNIVLSVIGACLLWFGWFGFNAGSALSSGSLATNAFVTTHFAAAAAMIAWTAVEWIKNNKPTVLGAISGAVSGLVVITPAAGFVTPMTALFIGLCAGIACYFAVDELKHLFGYDDTLDVFGIHGVAGIIGAVMTGVFATSAVNPIFKDAAGVALPVGYVDGNAMQIVNQLIAICLAILFAGGGSFIILKVVDTIFGLRVEEQHEIAGLDLTQHGEVAYVYALKETTSADAALVIRGKSNVMSSQELAFEISE
jgi:Amt family ammonium transporter